MRETAVRDYGNMPQLDWADPQTALKARAQILHQEPVVLVMPEDTRFPADPAACGGELDADSGILVNCDPAKALVRLAEINAFEAMGEVAEAAVVSGSRVDVDAAGRRIIVHD